LRNLFECNGISEADRFRVGTNPAENCQSALKNIFYEPPLLKGYTSRLFVKRYFIFEAAFSFATGYSCQYGEYQNIIPAMKVSIFLIATFIVACSNGPLHQNNKDTVSNGSIPLDDTLAPKKTGKPVVDTFINHPTGYKDISKFQDTTINGIKFNDCDTIDKLFGDKFELLPDIDDLPAIQILNADKTQLLTMYMWNGSAKCDFSQFQVEYASKRKKYYQAPFTLDTKSFFSGRNIYLGVAASELKKRIGQPNEVRTENGIQILSYQEYNNLYFGDYYFRDGKLIKFRFGEEYP
jgi:hypothetical protein